METPHTGALPNMSDPQSGVKPSPAVSATSRDPSVTDSSGGTDGNHVDGSTPLTAPPLATQPNQRMESALGDVVLRLLRIRKGPKGDEYDLDAVRVEHIWRRYA